MRRALRSFAASVADESGVSSVEYAVMIAVTLLGTAAAAYVLGTGVSEPPRRIVTGQIVGVGTGTSSTYRPVEPVELVVPPPNEPDSPLWPWALFSLILSTGCTATVLAVRRAMELASHAKVRRKVREATSDMEIEGALERIKCGPESGLFVRLRPGDMALVGRNMPKFNLDWIRSTEDTEPSTAPVDHAAVADREATVARFMAAFTTANEPVTPPVDSTAPPAPPNSEPSA